MLRVLRRKLLRAFLHNRDRLQSNYCDFSLPRRCYLLEKYAPYRQRRLRSATLYPTELRARCYGINDLRVFRPFGFAYALHYRQTQEISRPAFVWATESICIIEQRTNFVHHANGGVGGGDPPVREMDSVGRPKAKCRFGRRSFEP